MFKVGDKIRGINDHYNLDFGNIFTVIEEQWGTYRYIDYVGMTIEITYFEDTPHYLEDFELVESAPIVDEPQPTHTVGPVLGPLNFTVANEITNDIGKNVSEYVQSYIAEFTSNCMELYDENKQLRVRVGGTDKTTGEPLGVYRPNLEDRKVDKVRVELVDHGFPNALWALAEVMTWAQAAKGYKDHDWKNLPVGSLQAAASRHRQKQNMGEMFDHESKLLHKAHEAFGVLAELELLLTANKSS